MSMEDVMVKYMNAPEPPTGKSIIVYGKTGTAWVACCYCGQRQFPLTDITKIKHMNWTCKNSKCKKEFEVSV